LVLAGIGWASSSRAINHQQLARDIAARNPDLHALLLTAVEQERDPATGRLSYLQERVLNDALVEIRRHEKLQPVPPRTMVRAHSLHAVCCAAFLGILLLMPQGNRIATKPSFLASGGVTVTPGDVSLEKGNGLVVLAKFNRKVPDEAALVIVTNGVEQRIPLARNLNDPVFGGSIPEVRTSLKYRVEFGSDQTEDFNVTVFEYPRLDRADVSITYPGYTELQPKKIADTRRVSAVEGSQMDVALQLNKPVKSARLIGKDNSVVTLATETNRAQAHLAGFKFEKSQSYQLQLVDADGRTNKMLAQFTFDVLTNQRPQLKIAAPRGDRRVSPLQEVSFQAEAQDDFGLRGWGLTYSIGGDEEKTLALGGTAPAHVKTNFAHLMRLEELKLKPDQLISYFVWADDMGPDGQLRRTASDLFFAEVRPFEEIFREGESAASQQQQQQQQQQQGNQSPATKLAELQKQIINATWNLVRNHTSPKPSEKYLKDEPVVRDSQERALSQVEAMQEQLENALMQEHARAAEKHMSAALDQLNAATNSIAPLPKALAAEQAAYQALLKLQSREHQVVQSRQQQRGQQQSAAQPSQSQLSQLDLKRQQDRYETEREAAPQLPQDKKEQLEALNRLKELAQRQEDINERLKEMQTELQAAKTEKERTELQRELKRLRDEEREMLADMDQLRQRMEQPQNQSEMAEAREQLEQARQEAQKASEALEKESVQQALAAGTRAGRQLEQMRDEMRKQTSGQFSEEMRQMRTDARDLADKQEEIRKEMQAQNDKPKTLSDSGETEQLANKLGEQKQAVTNILDQMKRVTEQAEAAEPLLSKHLYDSLRRTSQGNLDQALTAAEELSKRNFMREAQQFEQRAGKEIEALKNDVEKAAQSVLGDDTESLRAARRELDQLASQLQRELARAAVTNAGLSNALAAASPGGANRSASLSGSNRMAAAAGGGTNGTNIASGRGRGTNDGFAMTSTNGSSRGARGTNGASGRDLAANQPGRPGESQRTSERQGQQGQQSGDGQGQRAGNNNDQQQTVRAEQPGENASPSEQQGQQGREGQNGSGRGNNRGDRLAELFDNQPSNNEQRGGQNGGGMRGGPITGEEEFREWSQRLSNVEEMVDRPALRNELAQARDRARAARAEFKRHGKEPQWDLLHLQVLGPLLEVRDRINDELSRRDSNESLAPIDRDPVPGKYGDLVRRYYETLGGSQ
ncbi:MAG TPA: hypothetical protein VK530_00130, partial [Candidatus Acidoferrum sp.]|nr:hypothetical protein [Candidatus Acidoferrum sp.]